MSQEREITLFATRGEVMKKIKSSATTWGELKPLVSEAGFDLSSLLAAESVTRHDLINDMAILPEGPFRIFLRPAKTKSGALGSSRKEIFATIKAHLTVYPEDKARFIVDGKNMTQISTPVLQELVEKYCKESKGESSNTPVEPEVKEDMPTKSYAENPMLPADCFEAPQTCNSANGADMRGSQKEMAVMPSSSKSSQVEEIHSIIQHLNCCFSSFDKTEEAILGLEALKDEVEDHYRKFAEVDTETEEQKEARAIAAEARSFMDGY